MGQGQLAKPRHAVYFFVPSVYFLEGKGHFSQYDIPWKKKTLAFNYCVTTNPGGSGAILGAERRKNKAVQLWAEDEEIFFLSQAKVSLLSSGLPTSLSQPHAGTEDTVIPEMAHGNEPVALLIAEHHFSEKVSPSSFQGDFCCGWLDREWSHLTWSWISRAE